MRAGGPGDARGHREAGCQPAGDSRRPGPPVHRPSVRRREAKKKGAERSHANERADLREVGSWLISWTGRGIWTGRGVAAHARAHCHATHPVSRRVGSTRTGKKSSRPVWHRATAGRGGGGLGGAACASGRRTSRRSSRRRRWCSSTLTATRSSRAATAARRRSAGSTRVKLASPIPVEPRIAGRGSPPRYHSEFLKRQLIQR